MIREVNSMRENNVKKYMIILFILMLVLLAGILSLSIAVLFFSELLIGKDTILLIVALVLFIALFVLPLPCIICSVILTFLAWKAYRKNIECNIKWIAVGIVDIVLSSSLFALLVFVIDTFMRL